MSLSFLSSVHNWALEPLSKDLSGTFKLRIGDWRAIYTIEADTIVIQCKDELMIVDYNQYAEFYHCNVLIKGVIL